MYTLMYIIQYIAVDYLNLNLSQVLIVSRSFFESIYWP
jgi:hypothetical protein